MANFENAFRLVIENEGGLVDDPNDSGNLTKYGISQKAYPNEYIETLTIDRAKFLYKRDYWDKIKGDNLYNQSIAELIFDTAVNLGVIPAITLAQRTVMIKDDGIVGPNTIAALNAQNATPFMNAFALRKIEYYIKIIKKKPSQLRYAVGWIDRTLKMVL